MYSQPYFISNIQRNNKPIKNYSIIVFFNKEHILNIKIDIPTKQKKTF